VVIRERLEIRNSTVVLKRDGLYYTYCVPSDYDGVGTLCYKLDNPQPLSVSGSPVTPEELRAITDYTFMRSITEVAKPRSLWSRLFVGHESFTADVFLAAQFFKEHSVVVKFDIGKGEEEFVVLRLSEVEKFAGKGVVK
jgi:hypothetical protein